MEGGSRHTLVHVAGLEQLGQGRVVANGGSGVVNIGMHAALTCEEQQAGEGQGHVEEEAAEKLEESGGKVGKENPYDLLPFALEVGDPAALLLPPQVGWGSAGGIGAAAATVGRPGRSGEGGMKTSGE